jgi:hypothetical protein
MLPAIGKRGNFLTDHLGTIIILLIFLVIILLIIGLVLAPKFGGELPFP